MGVPGTEEEDSRQCAAGMVDVQQPVVLLDVPC